MQALESSTRGRTLLLITHRLESARFADRIVVLEAGAIVDNAAVGLRAAESSAAGEE